MGALICVWSRIGKAHHSHIVIHESYGAYVTACNQKIYGDVKITNENKCKKCAKIFS